MIKPMDQQEQTAGKMGTQLRRARGLPYLWCVHRECSLEKPQTLKAGGDRRTGTFDSLHYVDRGELPEGLW